MNMRKLKEQAYPKYCHYSICDAPYDHKKPDDRGMCCFHCKQRIGYKTEYNGFGFAIKGTPYLCPERCEDEDHVCRDTPYQKMRSYAEGKERKKIIETRIWSAVIIIALAFVSLVTVGFMIAVF